MNGRLFVVGVGPGDPELLTLKAVRILNQTPCLFVPKGKENGDSIALSIVEKVLDLSQKEVVEAHFPMLKTKGQAMHDSLPKTWKEIAHEIYQRLKKGSDVAFITIGDPTIYCTFFYLHSPLLEIDPHIQIEIVPGVSSINASASCAGISLGLADEKIAILPATYMDSVSEFLDNFDTIILMKVHRVFDRVLDVLRAKKLIKNAIYVVKAGMAEEKVIKDVETVKKDELEYLSVMIIKK